MSMSNIKRPVAHSAIALVALVAGAVSGCGTAGGFAPVKHVAPLNSASHRPLPASKRRPAALLKIPHGDVGYPSEGVILGPIRAGFVPQVSSAHVLKSLKKNVLARDILGSTISSTPTIWLKLITEYQPTYPGLRPGVKYTGWVVRYTGVKPVSHGLRPLPRHSKLRCIFIGIFDIAKSAWTTFFVNCPG